MANCNPKNEALCAIVKQCQTLTTIDSLQVIPNPDIPGSFILEIKYTGEDGIVQTQTTPLPGGDDIHIQSVTFTNATRVLTIVETDGTPYSVVIPETLTTLNPITITGTTLNFSYTGENGVVQTQPVDISSLLTADTQDLSIAVDGHTLQLVNGGSVDLCPIVQLCETTTAISPLTLTGTVLSTTYTDEDGNVNVLSVDLAPLNIITTVTDTVAGNPIATYTNEAGATVAINETITTLVNNGDDTLTYTSENATQTVINVKTTIIDNGDGTVTFITPSGAVTTLDICQLTADGSCVTSLVDNGDGTYLFTNEAGVTTTINTAQTVTAIDNGNGTYTITDDFGNSININTNDVITTVTNTVAGNPIATYTNEAGAVVAINETITTLTNAGNGILSYTDEAGSKTNISICDLLQASACDAQVIDNGDGTYSITDNNGNTITINTNQTSDTLVSSNSGNVIATHTDVAGNVINIEETITTLVNNGDGTLAYTNEAGVTVNLDICSIINASTCAATAIDNGDGTYTITGNDGNSVIINTNAPATTNVLDSVANTMTSTVNGVADSAPIINSNTLNLDGNGDLISTINGIASTPLNLPSDTLTSSNTGKVIATHTDVDGNAVAIQESITNLIDNGDGSISYTNENGATVTIPVCDLINSSACAATAIDNGNGTYTITGNDGSSVTFNSSETVTTLTNTVAGHLIGTYTNEAGTVVNINETVTALGTLSLVGNILTVPYTDENGVVTNRTIDLSSLAIDINVTSLTYNPVTGEIILTETDGTTHTIDIGPFVETSITVVDTNSINLTSSGTSGHTIQADVRIDPASCGLTVTADGLLSTAVSTVVDTPTVDLTKNGCDISADVKISATAGNDIVANADGLFVDVTANETPFVANDSSTVDFTTSGVNGHTLTGVVKISATAGNDLVANADGLFVDVPTCEDIQDCVGTMLNNAGLTYNDGANVFETTGTNGQVYQANGTGGGTWVTPAGGHVPVTTVDSTTVDFTQSGTDNQTVTADVKISSTAGNDLTSDATGLFLDVTANETTFVANDSDTIDFTTSGVNGHTVTGVVKTQCEITSDVNGLKLADTFYDATSMAGVTGAITAPVVTGPIEEVYFVKDACSIRGFVNKAASSATTNVLDSAANVMTSTVNGVADTAPIINSNVVTYSAGNLTTTVNGVVSNSVAIPQTPLVANDSSTIDFTTSGTDNHTVTGVVKISATAGNDLVVNADGLFVDVPTCEDIQDCVGTMLTTVGFTYNDAGNNFTSGGTTGQVLTTNGTGGATWTTIAAGHVPVTTVDSTTIDFTASGTDNQTVTATVKIDPASCNLSATANGLLSTAKNITNAVAGGTDLNTITQTVTGCDTALKLALSTDAGQILQAGTDGKLLAQISATTETIGATGSILIQNDADATIERLKDPLCADATTVSTTVLGDKAGKWGAVHAQDWLTVRAVSASTTLVPATDSVIAVSAAGGSRTITLVAPTGCERRDFWIKRTDNVVANTVTLTGGGNIEGVASITLTAVGAFGGNYGESAHIVWSGTEWLII